MSKETEPIRSRRQLREQLAQSAGAAGNPPASGNSAPAGPASAKPGAKPASAPVATPEAAPSATSAADAKPKPDAAPSTAPSGKSDAAPKERQSQTRARDRAALRAYKELLDQPSTAPLPSRRALRQAQIDADRAPVTAVNPVVSPPLKPAVAPPARPPASQAKAPIAGRQAPAGPGEGQDGSPSSTQKAGNEARPGAKGTPNAAAANNAAGNNSVANNSQARTRGGRRAAAREPLATVDSAAGPVEAASKPAEAEAAPPSAVKAPHDAPLSPVEADAAQEQALAAIKEAAAAAASRVNGPPEDKLPAATEAGYPPLPGLVPGGSYYPVSAGPPPAIATPSEEELQALAAERAEAERAAILAERAQARDRLARESAKNRRAADPTATNNLAMVTPLEFIEVEGSDRPVLRQPSTTHVPIVTRATPRQAPGRRVPPRPEPKPRPATPGEGPAKQQDAPEPKQGTAAAGAERFDAALDPGPVRRSGTGERPAPGGRSSTLKRAEAMATGGQQGATAAAGKDAVTRSQMPPMPADYAHGLEPLDAVTAGLGRTQRNLLLLWGSIVVGGAALIACLIMIFTL